MTSNNPETTGQKSWLRVSLRALMLMVLVAAAYCAGWVSHRQWNKKNVEDIILDAGQRIGGPVKVETAAPGVIMSRGKKHDVDEMNKALRKVDGAARK